MVVQKMFGESGKSMFWLTRGGGTQTPTWSAFGVDPYTALEQNVKQWSMITIRISRVARYTYHMEANALTLDCEPKYIIQ